jgi:hypothetical protein
MRICYPIVLLAAATATKHHHHVDWTAITAVAAIFSSFAAILVAVFNPWIGYTKARLELLTEKLEKLYQLVKEERRTASEMMIRFRSNVPTKTDGARELEKPAEDFRKFKEGNSDVDVLIDLFFRGIRPAWRECRDERGQFVICWYNLYNHGIEPKRVQEIVTAQIQVMNRYDLLESGIRFKAQALGDQRTSAGIIKAAVRDLLTGIARRSGKTKGPTNPPASVG